MNLPLKNRLIYTLMRVGTGEREESVIYIGILSGIYLLLGWVSQRGRKALRRVDRGGEDVKKVTPSPPSLPSPARKGDWIRYAESIVVSRAARFGAVSSDTAKMKMRALRFGIPDKDKTKAEEKAKMEARAKRFGLVMSSYPPVETQIRHKHVEF